MSRRLPIFLAAALFTTACPPSAKPALSDKVVGRCEYTGQFSKLTECKDYLGAWTFEASQRECADLKGVFEGGILCQPAEFLGACLFATAPEQARTYIVSNNTAKCGSARTGCETFGGGYWDVSPLCGGANDELVVLENAWTRPERVCLTPKAGEPPGSSPNGQVCLWQGIHGATENGRSYRDDASCDRSRSGRPYYQRPADPRYDQPDPRRSDPAYLAEEAWVRSQINATACVCCHAKASPNGESAIFDIDRPGSLANQLTDRGIGQASGLLSSIPLGAWPADQNNGFSKSDLEHPADSVFLSTDPARMKTFWSRELAHRGLTLADFDGVPDGFGPLSEQYGFRPEACTGSERIAADGTLFWGKCRARYVYVLEAAARAPTVFPNLDVPVGTVWKLDVPATGAPLVSGTVQYGVAPEGTQQAVPAAGAPAALESGKQYFLYVTADQMLPITRCLVTAP
jgi:hypothetical protein